MRSGASVTCQSAVTTYASERNVNRSEVAFTGANRLRGRHTLPLHFADERLIEPRLEQERPPGIAADDQGGGENRR